MIILFVPCHNLFSCVKFSFKVRSDKIAKTMVGTKVTSGGRTKVTRYLRPFFFGAEEERSVMVISEIVGTTSSLPDLTDFQTLTFFFALVNVSWHKFILLQSYRGKML